MQNLAFSHFPPTGFAVGRAAMAQFSCFFGVRRAGGEVYKLVGPSMLSLSQPRRDVQMFTLVTVKEDLLSKVTFKGS